MEQALSNEYWKKRCELAEKYIKDFLADYCFHGSEYKSFDKWTEFTESPTDTALYTGFIEELKSRGMWYEFYKPKKPDYPYELRFWYNGTNFKQEGCVITSMTVYKAFEKGLEMVKTIELRS